MPLGIPQSWHHPARLLRLAALVFLCCWAGIVLTRADGRIAAIWLSNGLVLGILLSTPTRHWLAILAAGYGGNLAANLVVGDAGLTAPLLAGCNTAEILVAAAPLRRRFGEALDLTTPRALLSFALFALLLAPALSAVLAMALLGADTTTEPDQFLIWFAADAMGMLIVTPLVIALHTQADVLGAPLEWRQTRLPWLLVLTAGVLVFSQSRYPLLFVLFPPLLLLSYLHGLKGSMLGVATLTVVAVIATSLGHGPIMLIHTGSMQVRILFLQVFVLIAAVQGLVVGMLLAQRQRLTLALHRSEQSLRTVTDNLPALIAHIDREERYRFANAHIGKVFGSTPTAMLGRTMREVRGEAIYADIAPHVRTALGGATASFENHAVVQGRHYHYQSNYVPDVAADGSVRGFFAMTFDITARKAAELRQAADEERLRTITDNLPALITYFDHEGIYRFCNQTHADWFGKPIADWIGNHYRHVLDQAFADAQAPHIEAALAGHRVDTELALEILGSRRTLSASYIPHRNEQGEVVGVYKLMNDITRLKAVQAELSHLARSDMLTGLANRREFQDRLEATIERSRRSGEPHALMFLDIDHFKAINDTHGHAVGDAVLREVAGRLQASVRLSDTVARLAGDEFVIILEALHTADESQFIARKIVAALEKPVTFSPGSSLRVSTSIGIAFNAQARLDAEQLLSLADSALYEAKAAGRNTYRLADSRNTSPMLNLAL